MTASESAAYRAATQQVEVEVSFTDGASLSGIIHLLPSTVNPRRYETPLEMLNRHAAFYAVEVPDAGAVLVSKGQTAVVSCPAGDPIGDPERLSAARSIHLDVELAGGSRCGGRAVWEAPPAQARASDFLNAPGTFFALLDGERALFVNRAAVRAAHPTD